MSQYIDTPLGKLYLQHWGAGRPIVALHGWLDNSASFSQLAPQLNGRLSAIDLPGHGLSDHYPHGFYHLWEYIPPLVHWLRTLPEPVDLIGHSMGGMIVPLLAVAAPDAINKLVLIDSLGGPPYGSTELVSWLKRLDTSSKPSRAYASLEDMIRVRMRGMTPLSYQAAKTIVEHQAYQADGQWHWHFDPAVKAGSPVRLRDDDYQACLKRIKAPMQVILAESGWVANHLDVMARLQWLPAQAQVQWTPGGHHCHLEQDEVANCAALIDTFLSQ